MLLFCDSSTTVVRLHWNAVLQVKEWLQSLGIVDHVAVVQDADEPDDGAVPVHQSESVKNR